MHKYERIALWSLLIIVLFMIIFKPRLSRYSGPAINLMDLQEFRTVPADIKIAYTTNAIKITDALGAKMSSDWARAGPAAKVQLKPMATRYADMAVSKISSAKDFNQALNMVYSMLHSQATMTTQPGGTTKSGYEMDNMGSSSEEQPQPDYQEEGYMYMIR